METEFCIYCREGHYAEPHSTMYACAAHSIPSAIHTMRDATAQNMPCTVLLWPRATRCQHIVIHTPPPNRDLLCVKRLGGPQAYIAEAGSGGHYYTTLQGRRNPTTLPILHDLLGPKLIEPLLLWGMLGVCPPSPLNSEMVNPR
jgi:hypothetical protein